MPIRGMQDKRELDKERLRELTFIDDLTSLYNRRYLYQYLPTELGDMQRIGKKVCLFMMDVDNFKEVNDTYGHLCGDKILMEIADLLHQSLRRGDTIVRYAGDEFIAILPGAEEEVAVNVAKRIIDRIDKNPFRESYSKRCIHVTISIGLALFPRDAQDPEKLIYQADQALYSSKRSGRNRICTTKDITTEVLDETRLQEIFPAPQLIGRDNHLKRLKELLDRAEKGESKLALIKGERGSGKTRLISELKNYAQLKDISNISVSCSPEISTQPYQILIMALENLFVSLGPEVREFIRSLPEAQITQLANYIPTLKQFLPESSKKEKIYLSGENRINLFKWLCQSLVYVVKKNALLLIIDDFHWIDKETLQLFNYIIKDLHNIPIFIVAAYREEELRNRTDDPAFKELLRQMEQGGLVDELVLEPLEKKDILKMITTVFTDIQVNPDFVDVVYDVSTGNPLFTEEVLRSLVNKGFIFYQNGRWRTREIAGATFPPFLKEAIQKRFTELDEETKPVISAAAVIGKAFNFVILCQLLEKDPGYVLEVIDRAVRQHLIMSESPFQTDKFKFGSEVIRDVIYGSLDSRRKQDLHRKLALIEEKAYEDNIDYVAGTLGYHFGKAQDTQKATLYTNMLLEGAKQIPTYEDVFNFLQEPFFKEVKEEEEEGVVPLSGASSKLIPTMLRSLKLATMNIRLYPTHSKVRQDFIEEVYKIVTNILDRDNILVISAVSGFLLINGEGMSEKTSQKAGGPVIIILMNAHRIKSITFKKNLTREQLVVFLEGLSQNYDDLISKGGLSGMLRKNGVSLIKVNEIRFEQTSKLTKQRTKFEEAMLIDYLIGKVSGLGEDKSKIITEIANDPQKLGEALKKIAKSVKVENDKDKTEAQANIVTKSLQKLSDQFSSQTKGGVGQYHKNIAKAMMTLDYRLRSKIIQSQVQTDKILTDKVTPKDVIKDVLGEFSDEELLDMVAREFSDSGGNLTNIRRLIYRFFLDPKRKQRLLPKLKDKLAQLGMSEEEVSWVLEEDFWQELSLKEKSERIISLAPESYTRLEVSKQIDNLVSLLLENDQYNQASKIIDKLLRQLEDESKQVGCVTINDLDKISETLIVKEQYFLLQQIINGLIARLDKEKDPQVYSLLTQVFATICARLIKRQNFIQAAGMLTEFNLRIVKTSKLLDIQKQMIKQAKDKIIATHSLLDWLTELLRTKIEGHHDFSELSKVIHEIGAAAIGPLFALGISKELYTDPFKTYALRWSIAKVLKTMGAEAIFYLKDRLADERAELVEATLELLGHIQDRRVVQYLQPLIKTENLDLRKEAITTLGKIGGVEAVKLLSDPIKDKNNQIRLATIWALANIGSPEAFSLLKSSLKDKGLPDKLKIIIQQIKRKENEGK